MHQELSTRVGDLSGPQLPVFLAASIKLIDSAARWWNYKKPTQKRKKRKKKNKKKQADIITFKDSPQACREASLHLSEAAAAATL